MDKENHKNWEHKHWNGKGGGNGGAVYCLGLVGAAIYHIQQSTTFMEGLIGILKAIVWPAFLVHKIFTLLGM